MDSRAFKTQLLTDLYDQYKCCQACPLGKLGRQNIVFGEGDPDSKLLLIGEAPGRDEDLLSKPFVGKSGQLLTKALEIAGINRKDIYITNIVKCRPPNNRQPNFLETTICKSLILDKQIKIIRPKLICTLGSCALQAVLGQKETTLKITKIHGKKIIKNSLSVIPIYHPAYILRNRAELESFISDLAFVKHTLKHI